MLSWQLIAFTTVAGSLSAACKDTHPSEPHNVQRSSFAVVQNARGDAEMQITVTRPAAGIVQATMPVKAGTILGDGAATEIRGTCQTYGKAGDSTCKIALPYEAFRGDGPFVVTFVAGRSDGTVESTTTETYRPENVATKDRLALDCRGGLTCDLVVDKESLALTVTSKTAPVTVTLEGQSGSAEAGKPARVAVPLVVAFARESSAMLVETVTKYKELPATITAGGRKVFEGSVTARPGDLVEAIALALGTTPPRPVAYASSPPPNARRAALVMPLVRTATASVLDAHVIVAGSPVVVDEIDLFVTLNSINARTVKCGWYASKDGSKGTAMEAQRWDTEIRVVERASGKVLGTKTTPDGGCAASALEGAGTANAAGVSIRGREVREYLDTFLR